MWAYLNWALGFHALGCNVIWLEQLDSSTPRDQVERLVAMLRSHLRPFGLADKIALVMLYFDAKKVTGQLLERALS